MTAEFEAILLAWTIPIEEIVGSGGGETKGTQRLRHALHEHGWRKHKFEITRSRHPLGATALDASGPNWINTI